MVNLAVQFGDLRVTLKGGVKVNRKLSAKLNVRYRKRQPGVILTRCEINYAAR